MDNISRLLLTTAIVCSFYSTAAHDENKTSFIIGGRPAKIQDIPYQIALLKDGGHYCGGSIIADKFILTAAHCIHGSESSVFSVLYGTDILSEGGTELIVRRLHVHPHYNDETVDNDIAILALRKPIVYSKLASNIKLGSNEAVKGENALVSGWGATAYDEGSDNLLRVNVSVISRSKCSKALRPLPITKNMICASAKGKDSCQGDSGGPLVIGNVQVGIVSFGIQCARPEYPGVYTNVARYKSYINKITKNTVEWS